MALVKGICPYCNKKKKDKSIRFIYINPDAEVSYCPNCSHSVTPKEVKEELEKYTDYLHKKADAYLSDYTDANKAYKEYALIIEANPDDIYARFGRLLALTRLSTLRKSTFIHVFELFIKEEEKYFRKKATPNDYIIFFRRLSMLVARYEGNAKRRLTYKDRFYDVDCGSLFALRLSEILVINKMIYAVLDRLEKKQAEHSPFYKTMERFIFKKNNMLSNNYKYLILDGSVYSFIVKDPFKGEVKAIKRGEHVTSYSNAFSRPTLTKEKGHPYINDKIYKNRNFYMFFYRFSIYAVILLLVATLIAGLASYFITKSLIASYILGSLGLIFLIISLSLIITKRVIKKKLRQRRDAFYSAHYIE